MRLLYSALLYALFPLVLLRMLWRSLGTPAYRQRLPERFGVFDTDFDPFVPTLWTHAVSVGEVLAAAPLLERLLQLYPDHRLVVTTTTPTGSERLQALFGDRVFHVYTPWDLPGSVRRFLLRVRPRLLLLMETELWPNLLHYSHLRGCKVILANARLSQRSARGYSRLAWVIRPMLADLDHVACQSVADGERFVSLGLSAERLTVTGNIKFDLSVDERRRSEVAALRDTLGTNLRPVLVAASTHAGEEVQILEAFTYLRQVVGQCLLVLVPRHPQRFDAVHALCTSRGWHVVRRSVGAMPGPEDDIVLGDTMGELALLSGAATVVFIGGSLVGHGGHNPLEAAAWAVPVVSGPSVFNFTQVCRLLEDAGAMVVLQEPDQLGDTLASLLNDPARREQMGSAGQRVVKNERGAREKLLALAAQQLAGA